MGKSLALIHTSLVFITVETVMQGIFADVMPDVRLINIVDDALLADVLAAGQITPGVMKRMAAYVQAAEAAGADAVLSLCTSLGPAVPVVRQLVSIPVIRIDEPMAEKAAAGFPRIGVMGTVASSLDPTTSLIEAKAAALGRDVAVRQRLVEGAFGALMRGERDRHDDMVSAAARELAREVDVIAFAQSSMTRLVSRLEAETGLPILTCPRLAIEHSKRVLDQVPPRAW